MLIELHVLLPIGEVRLQPGNGSAANTVAFLLSAAVYTLFMTCSSAVSVEWPRRGEQVWPESVQHQPLTDLRHCRKFGYRSVVGHLIFVESWLLQQRPYLSCLEGRWNPAIRERQVRHGLNDRRKHIGGRPEQRGREDVDGRWLETRRLEQFQHLVE